ncbi:uncharacterized protein AMSG_10875 [Thecamonas trahens ATCC 50062]|uniref:Protein Asterix n=1 Tax=Thecamonas trahens ATCC 50062 TaxID=461836 RepID=A0A0L0DT74_THETB|nr:hypothetical protein AMSG_10875 [Thecamonas trahens ATCC 50062]KNC55241.1 hypothetical protein AMSG_10875 [Thecamonas trahens ATCC 50062]|eukprot:XP_013753170.1 hypothetical protein AMSG_10875 [Thecamonas trahens ATCC 50062]
MSQSTASPVDPLLAVPEEVPENDEMKDDLAELLNMLAMMMGASGLMMRWKWMCWGSLFACVYNLCNARKIDYKNTLMQLMFALAGLFINYLAPPPPQKAA